MGTASLRKSQKTGYLAVRYVTNVTLNLPIGAATRNRVQAKRTIDLFGAFGFRQWLFTDAILNTG